jgi:hypothetical protein
MYISYVRDENYIYNFIRTKIRKEKDSTWEDRIKVDMREALCMTVHCIQLFHGTDP